MSRTSRALRGRALWHSKGIWLRANYLPLFVRKPLIISSISHRSDYFACFLRTLPYVDIRHQGRSYHYGTYAQIRRFRDRCCVSVSGCNHLWRVLAEGGHRYRASNAIRTRPKYSHVISRQLKSHQACPVERDRHELIYLRSLATRSVVGRNETLQVWFEKFQFVMFWLISHDAIR